MIIELNIGLEVNGAANNQAEIRERAIQAIGLLKGALGFDAVQTRRYDTEYEGPDGLCLERGLYARVNTARSVFEVQGLVYEIANALEQDCIAVYIPRSGVGRLVGPRAGKWGEFDLDFFTSFETGFDVVREAA